MAYVTVKRDIAPISLELEQKEMKHPQFDFTHAFIDTETVVARGLKWKVGDLEVLWYGVKEGLVMPSIQ